MRVKVRSASGSEVLTLSNDATVGDLISEMRKAISQPSGDMEVKIGFPPKPLPLHTYHFAQHLSDLPMKLNGEQLIVSGSSLSSSDGGTPTGASEATAPTSGPPAPQASEKKVYTPSQSEPKQADVPFSFTTGTTVPKPPAPQPQGLLNLSRATPKFNKDDPPDVKLPSGRGTLVLRVMEDDNSCLFRAISYVASGSMVTPDELRQIVVDHIQSDPEKYNEITLDEKPDKYCEWIKMESSWGGGIELAILASFLGIEIVAVDVESGSMIRENQGPERRAIVVYSGIHYDALALSLRGSSVHDISKDETQFDTNDAEILQAARDLCSELRRKRYFTDTKSFDLKCNACGVGLKGEKEAVQHANQTGHTDLSEFER